MNELDLDSLDREHQAQQAKGGMINGIVKMLKRKTEGLKNKDHVLHEEYKLYYPHTLAFEQAQQEEELKNGRAPNSKSIVARDSDVEEAYELADESSGVFFYHTIRVEKEIAASKLNSRHSVDETREAVHRG